MLNLEAAIKEVFTQYWNGEINRRQATEEIERLTRMFVANNYSM